MFYWVQFQTAEIISRATKSVPSPIKNLSDVNKHVNMNQLVSALGYVDEMNFQDIHFNFYVLRYL